MDQGPDWNRLYEIAAAQDGHFTTAQATEAGYYPQLLVKHVAAGRLQRVRRAIYRIVHFPAGEREDLTVLWLWSERIGVFSHETALSLHGLSDVLGSKVHMTLPAASTGRRLRVPDGLTLHHADIPEPDRAWWGSVPLTGPARTLADCAEAHFPPELLRQAVDEGLARGLFSRHEIVRVEDYLASFERAPR